jgi:hypothetical protein
MESLTRAGSSSFWFDLPKQPRIMFVAERQRWDKNCGGVDPESTSLLPLYIEEVAKAIMLADPTQPQHVRNTTGTQEGKMLCDGGSVRGGSNKQQGETLAQHVAQTRARALLTVSKTVVDSCPSPPLTDLAPSGLAASNEIRESNEKPMHQSI